MDGAGGGEVDVAEVADVIRAESLRKCYGQTEALVGLGFAIRSGEVVGLLGPNGAGKTTTLKILLGLLRPTEGRAHILGLDCSARAREVKERIGYCSDEPAFYDYLTGKETLEFIAQMRGLDHAEAWRRLDPLVQRFDFGPQLEVLTHDYSHGMKKKLALLCAFAHGPRVLLLDEPTNGLDPHVAHEVRVYLEERAADGVAVSVVGHINPTDWTIVGGVPQAGGEAVLSLSLGSHTITLCAQVGSDRACDTSFGVSFSCGMPDPS